MACDGDTALMKGKSMPPGPDPALAAMVKGRSDEEIVALSKMFGGPQTLTDMFLAAMVAQLDDQSFDSPIVLGYHITNGGDSYDHTVTVGKGPVRVNAADLAAACATVCLSFPDLIRVLAGVLDLGAATTDGRIQVHGDQAAAGRVLSVLADA